MGTIHKSMYMTPFQVVIVSAFLCIIEWIMLAQDKMPGFRWCSVEIKEQIGIMVVHLNAVIILVMALFHFVSVEADWANEYSCQQLYIPEWFLTKLLFSE